MFRADIQNVHLFRVIMLCFALFPEAGCGSADAGSCHEVKIAYMMRQIGPVQLVPERPGTGKSLNSHSLFLTCCTSKMEDSYMAAVRSEMQHKMRSYSFELKYLIDGHGKAFQETFESLVSFTSNLTCSLFDSAYSALASDCRLPVFQLFSDIRRHLSGDANSSLNNAVRRFYNDLFPLVYRRLLNPGIGRPSQDVSPFGPHPRLLVGSLSRALGPGRALSRLLRLAGEVVNSTEKVTLSRECGRGLVKMQYCSHCRGLTLIRPCTGLCHNVMKGCLVGVPMLLEFEISIQRYQWFLSELPEMLCESEMEVEQHTCWSGEDVVESYAGHVVGSTLKAQKENPETSIRHTDPALKEVKQRLERLTQTEMKRETWKNTKTALCSF
uniref:Uncharacterized protein n=1 Tax=Poecilia mexicana TaxID=48701 RepID=A0A3B3WU74_9TELE